MNASVFKSSLVIPLLSVAIEVSILVEVCIRIDQYRYSQLNQNIHNFKRKIRCTAYLTDELNWCALSYEVKTIYLMYNRTK